ncbi:type IV pilus modification PilV family protein [Psychromonas ossibalaenae]|uniref:type IV pilus modification PilV family protein n=1 Tax=Psychromonas ossibalaenae TaxID=444922 RepID=UPI000370FDB6|nr:prepilin-type N-terminal cleavage/methylation domain-containing protein [Psychromonas ossibalaenae]
MNNHKYSPQKIKGFTLVELVVGIVVLAIAMMVMNTMLISQSKDSLEPLYRLRASQLGQSILQNILAHSYDQNSDHNGGRYRCGEIWGDAALWYDGSVWQTSGTPVPIACSTVYGIDAGETAGQHQDFNDVDDFITSGFVNAVTYGDALGNNLAGQYQNYWIQIAVVADDSMLAVDTVDAGEQMKRIDVTVRTPSDEQILFSAFKGNY